MPWPLCVQGSAETASLAVMLAKVSLHQQRYFQERVPRRGGEISVPFLCYMWWWFFKLAFLSWLIPRSVWWPAAILSPKSFSQRRPYKWMKSILPPLVRALQTFQKSLCNMSWYQHHSGLHFRGHRIHGILCWEWNKSGKVQDIMTES